jgi:hypothetical protein
MELPFFLENPITSTQTFANQNEKKSHFYEELSLYIIILACRWLILSGVAVAT